MSFRVEVSDEAVKSLKRLSRPLRARCWARALALADDPRPRGSSDLRGALKPFRKFRVGDYRVLYHVDDGAKLLRVICVAHRSRVYDELGRKR